MFRSLGIILRDSLKLKIRSYIVSINSTAYVTNRRLNMNDQYMHTVSVVTERQWNTVHYWDKYCADLTNNHARDESYTVPALLHSHSFIYQ